MKSFATKATLTAYSMDNAERSPASTITYEHINLNAAKPALAELSARIEQRGLSLVCRSSPLDRRAIITYINSKPWRGPFSGWLCLKDNVDDNFRRRATMQAPLGSLQQLPDR
jgi:hypothetical protein